MRSDRRHRVAITGYGPRGRIHVGAFLALSDRFEVVGVCDTDAERRDEARRALPAETSVFASTEAMLHESKPDVFSFCTPPAIRWPLFEVAAKCGIKAIACEKPLALTLEEGLAIRELWRRGAIKVVVSQQMKYGPHFQRVKALIKEGRLGHIRTIHATSKGWMSHSASHLLDYMMFFSGETAVQWVCGHVNGRSLLSDSHPSPEYLLGNLRFANDTEGIVQIGPSAPDVPGEERFWFNTRLAVLGDDGVAEVRVGNGWRAIVAGAHMEGPGCYAPEHDQAAYLRDLADWLEDDRKVHPCNGEYAFAGVEALAGILESALTHRRVDLPFIPTRDPIEAMKQALPEQPFRGSQWR